MRKKKTSKLVIVSKRSQTNTRRSTKLYLKYRTSERLFITAELSLERTKFIRTDYIM